MFRLLLVTSLVLLVTGLPQKGPASTPRKQSVEEALGKKPEELPKTMKEALKRMEAVDVEKVLNNDRILTNYLKCFLNKGPCTSEAKNVKKFIALLVESRCVECDPKQRKIIKKSMQVVKTKKPREYQELIKLYDPKGTQIAELEKFFASSK
nr:PREDICTED: ejaculatory bulb-specific protein 3-like [Bemisia tabaci]